jgi:hypothetical protein
MNKKVMKSVKKFKGIVEEELVKVFSYAEEEVKEAIMTSYRTELVVNDRNSKTNPQLEVYVEEMLNRLDEFEYVKEGEEEKITFVVPDMENFDFSGSKMRVIEQILEGTVGVYVEVNAEDYEKMFGKRVLAREPLDASVSRKEIIYLMRYNSIVRTAERNTFGRRGYLVRYPFSNTPSIRIFDSAEKLVDDKMGDWIEEALKSATKQQRMAA